MDWMFGRWQWPLRSTTAALPASSCSFCNWAWRFCFARSMEAMVVVAPFDDASERALLRAWVVAGCLRRLLDEASTAGLWLPRPIGASQATRRRRAPVAACHGVTAGAAGFWTNGSSRVSRRRATRRRGDVAVVRSVRDGCARGAAHSGPLMERKLRGAPRGAICYLRPRRTELRTDWRCSH